MYFEEKMIDGIMHYRTTLGGEWIPHTAQELSSRYHQMRRLIFSGESDGEAVHKAARLFAVNKDGQPFDAVGGISK